MVKCDICSEAIGELFLEKIDGTIIKKPGFSKQYFVCPSCQKKNRSKEELLKQIS